MDCASGLEDENLITPVKVMVEEGTAASQKGFEFDTCAMVEDNFQTSYILNVLCTSRKIRDNFHS